MTYYDDENGCRNGHKPTKRYESTGNCVLCHRERYNAMGHKRRMLYVDVPYEQRELFFAVCKAYGWETDWRKKGLLPNGRTPEQEAASWRQLQIDNAERLGKTLANLDPGPIFKLDKD
jgi:hypothetical protein